jgi:hypothetical protein
MTLWLLQKFIQEKGDAAMVDEAKSQSRVTRQEVIDAVHAGMRQASRTFETWSGGLPIITFGVENMISTYISMSLFNSFGKRGYMVTPETPFGVIEEWANAEARTGRPRSILSNQHRADVVLWNDKSKPVGVIEVKRHWTSDRCLNDIDRLDALLDRYGSLSGGAVQYGLLAVMLGCDPEGRPRDPDEQCELIVGQISKHIEKRYQWLYHLAPRKHRVGDTSDFIEVEETGDPYVMSSLVIELKGRRA